MSIRGRALRKKKLEAFFKAGAMPRRRRKHKWAEERLRIMREVAARRIQRAVRRSGILDGGFVKV